MKMIFEKNTKQYLLGACIVLCALIILILLVKYVLLDPTKIEVEQVEESKIASEVLASTADFQKGLDSAMSGDYVTALKEWRPLAEQGSARAQYNLGQMYRNGNGVLQDYQEAVKWFRLAAEQGHVVAQYNLGGNYFYGKGVLKDNKKAVKWFRLAAEKGHVEAQTNLGVMYALGNGVIEDKVLAHMWWNIAASLGNENAKKYRDEIVEEMIASQIEEAQRLVIQCVENNYKGC